MAGVEGRTDSIDSRLIALESAASLPPPPPPPSTNGWGDVPNNNSQSSNWNGEVPTSPPNFPSHASSTPRDASHWDRLSNPTILRINSNKNKVSLEAVKAAFAEFFESINLKSEHFSFEGPEVGSQFSIDIIGTMASAAKRAKYILQHVKKEDGGPTGPAVYWQFQALDVSGHGVPIYLNGDKNGRIQKLEGVTKRFHAHLKSAAPGTPVYARRSEGLLTSNFRRFVVVSVTQEKSDIVWDPKIARELGLDMPKTNKYFLEGENIQWCG